MGAKEVGEFLSSQRSRVDPDGAGFPGVSRRRVPGLRREEVAVLAGVSVDYYTRLEQGRERNPSPQVLDALAHAFDLDDEVREHLFRLASLTPPLQRNVTPTSVGPDLLQLMDSWPSTPVSIIDRNLDVLARNDLGAALYRGFDMDDNLARMTFLDPAGRRFYIDWERATTAIVANLRLAFGADPRNARLQALLGELCGSSVEFVELWSRHDVRGKTHEAKRFQHPDVGLLELSYQAFDVRSAPGQELIVYQAEPASPSATALQLLGNLAATSRQAGESS